MNAPRCIAIRMDAAGKKTIPGAGVCAYAASVPADGVVTIRRGSDAADPVPLHVFPLHRQCEEIGGELVIEWEALADGVIYLQYGGNFDAGLIPQ